MATLTSSTPSWLRRGQVGQRPSHHKGTKFADLEKAEEFLH
jgi:hypothetical protein